MGGFSSVEIDLGGISALRALFLGYSVSFFFLYLLKGINAFRIGIGARELIRPFVRVLREFFLPLFIKGN